MTAPAALFTLDTFWEYINQHPLEAGYYELDKGEIEMVGGTGGKHGTITMRLSGFIHTLVEQQQLGVCTAAETCYVLSVEENLVRCPDFAFISSTRAPQPMPDGYIPLSPDFAVEVKSPTDSLRKLRHKCDEYLRYGVRLVWLVLPETQQVEVYRPEHDILIVSDDEALLGYEVLPNFSLPASAIFPR